MRALPVIGHAFKVVLLVATSLAACPALGKWLDRGKLKTHLTGIGGTVFDHAGKRYFVYSAYVGDHSDLVIAQGFPVFMEGAQQRVG